MIPAAELIKCLQLINSENVGPVTFYKLLERYQTLDNVLEVLPSLKKYRLFAKSAAEREYERAQAAKIRIVTFQDLEYPQNLRQLNDAPPVLYVRGNPNLLNAPAALSVVGARNASVNGRKTASRISYDLTNNGILIVSGMARGIDSAAHKGAMYALRQKARPWPCSAPALISFILRKTKIFTPRSANKERSCPNFRSAPNPKRKIFPAATGLFPPFRRER